MFQRIEEIWRVISSLNNGQVKTVNGMQVQPLITFTSDQAYVKVTYKVYNPADTAKVIGLCGGADIMIGEMTGQP